MRRAREWTEALTRWCDEQPQLVAFSGRCHAHRAEIMQLDGAWPDALVEARRARERGERAMNRAAAGHALYQQGRNPAPAGRLRGGGGGVSRSETFGREPQPGLALLRLAQGDAETAAAAYPAGPR